MIGFHYGIVIQPNASLADLREAFEDAAENIYYQLHAPNDADAALANRVTTEGARLSIHIFPHLPESTTPDAS